MKNRNEMFDKIMPKHSVCAEVGVQEGINAVQILKRTLPKQLHLIDPWNLHYYESVKEMMAGKPVTLHRGRSMEIGRNFPDNFFDWVYVDANHLYKFVSEDLHFYYRKIKHGGILAGHDFSRPNSMFYFDGVKKAVHEILNEGLCKLMCFTDETQRSFAMRVVK